MNTESGLERCLTFIHSQLHPASALVVPPPGQWRAVTISRQSGSGGHAVAEALAEYLQAHDPAHLGAWTVFDRNLVETVLEDHHLRARLAKFMPEDRVTEFNDTLDEICGLHPPSSTLVEKTAETILRLAELGNVILLGRGGNIVTSRLGYVFHVRLVGSLEKRVENIRKYQRVGRDAALATIHREDLGRRRYLKKYYGQDIDDPLLYHLTINMDHINHLLAARVIAETMLSSRDTPAVQTHNAAASRAA